MTTQLAQPAETNTHTYAAAASGQHPSLGSATRSPASRSGVSTPASANGSAEPPRTQKSRSANEIPQPTSDLSPQSQEISRQSSPSMRTASLKSTKEDGSESTAPTVPDDHWEKSSQASSQAENKSAEQSKPTVYAEAAPPAVNVWNKRKEERAAKGSSMTVATASTPVASPVIGIGEKRAPSVALVVGDEKNKSKGDLEHVAGKVEHVSDDRSKSVERVPPHGVDSDEGSSKQTKAWKKVQEKEPAPVIPPPPVTDTVFWPTPNDVLQTDVKKERKDDREKDKTAPHAGRIKKWEPVKIDLPYTPPIVGTKSGRGRGNRGARDGGRGGANVAEDRGEGMSSGAAEGDRGRNSGGSNSRGGYQGSKPTKRSSSSGGNVRRRESKDVTNGGAGRKRDGTGEWNLDGPGRSAGMQTDMPQQDFNGIDAGNYSGDPRHNNDSFDKYNANGQHTYPRGDRNANTQYAGPRGEGEMGAPFQSGGTERGRGGIRGRGGYRGQHNGGHHGSGNYTAIPFNPSSAATQYANAYPAHQRGGYKGSSRGHFPTGGYRYNPQMQPPPFSPQYQASYDYPNPMAQLSPPPITQQEFDGLITQVNYYFSVDNLLKDLYLRKFMTSDGFVPLTVILGFKLIKLRTQEMNVLRDAITHSIELEYKPEGYMQFVRPRNGWERWPLDAAERHEDAKDNYAKYINAPPPPAQTWAPVPGQSTNIAAPPPPFYPGMNNSAPGYPVANPYQQPFSPVYPPYGYQGPTTALSGDAQEYTGPSTVQNGHGPPNPSLTAVDEIDNAGIRQLIVVTKRSKSGDDNSRSKVNGIADERSVNEILNDAGIANSDGTQDMAVVNGMAPPLHRSAESHSNIAWVIGSEDKFKAEESRVAALNHKPYDSVRNQSLEQRETLGPAKCSDMNVLYRFWSHFLVTKYNESMYNEFKKFALEDADASARSGLEYLFKFYAKYILRPENVGINVIQDMVKISTAEAQHGESFGVEKLKTILANEELNKVYRQTIESLLGSDVRSAMVHGVGKKHEKSQPPESYVTLCLGA